MTELIPNHQLTDEEGVWVTGTLDGAACHAPALRASSTTPENTGSSDEVETQWPLRRATHDTPQSPADRIESPPAEDAHEINAQPYEVCTPDTPATLPLEPDCETSALHTQIMQMVAGRTRLPDSVSALVAFWAISTWFQDAFTVFPCLVVTGPAHEAMVILRVLHELCCAPILLAGFKRADLKELNRYRTLLISEQNLDARTAALFGNLTNRDFALVEQGSYLYCANSKAVYIGEDPAIKRIQHSICIDATVPARTDGPVPGQPAPETIDAIRNHILEYRTRNLDKVRSRAGFRSRPLR